MIEIPDVYRFKVFAVPMYSLDPQHPLENRLYEYPDKNIVFKPLTKGSIAIVDVVEYEQGIRMPRTIDVWVDTVGRGLGVTVDSRTILYRLQRGWAFADAIRCGPKERNSHEYDGSEKCVIDDECKTMNEWCEMYNIALSTVLKRMKKERVTFKEAVTRPLEKTGPKAKHYTYNGETHTLDEWARITGIKPMTIRTRLYQGWELGEALGTPVERRRQRL